MEKVIDENLVLMRIIHKPLGSKLIFILQIRQTGFQFHFLSVNATDMCIEHRGSWKQKKLLIWDLGAEGRQASPSKEVLLIQRWR